MHAQFPGFFSDTGGVTLDKDESGRNQKSASVPVEGYDLKKAALNNCRKDSALNPTTAKLFR